MIKVVVCDDEEKVRIELSAMIHAYFKEIERAVSVDCFRSVDKFLKYKRKYDLIFLDIEMPGLNGIETAERLRKWDVHSKIIFVTNHNHYKNSAFKVHVFDYISKPLQKNSIYESLKEVVRFLDNMHKKLTYVLKTQEGIVTLELDDIYYFEYLVRKVIIHSTKGEYVAFYTLKQLYEKFNRFHFELSHKSFIINMMHVKCIRGFEVFMDNGIQVPLAQKRAVEFKEKFNDFLQTTFDVI